MRLAVLLLLFPLTCLAQESDKNALLEQLRVAQEKWRQLGPESYSFKIANGCFCLQPTQVGPIRIAVRKDKVRRTIYIGERSGDYLPGKTVQDDTPLKKTVPELFAQIEQVIGTRNPQYLRVEYDSRDGHPVRIKYDDPGMDKEEFDIVIGEFK